MTLRCLAIGLVVTLASGLLAAQASARDHRPARQGHPCGQHSRLIIVADGPGYSIRPRPEEARSTVSLFGPSIALGASLKLDARIFVPSTAAKSEGSHASHQ